MQNRNVRKYDCLVDQQFTDLLRASKYYPKFTKQPDFKTIRKLRLEAVERGIISENQKMADRINQTYDF